MERIKITIHPAPSDQQLLRVSDAMQQVIDYFRLLEMAGQGLASPNGLFDWRLERASTNSPLEIVGVAQPRNPVANISPQIQKIKSEFVSGMSKLIHEKELAPWMDLNSLRVARSVFMRTKNGVDSTVMELGPNDIFVIDKNQADAGIAAIDAIGAVTLVDEIQDRFAWGEIEGVMLAAGRYYNSPAIQIRNDLYGLVWCLLSKNLVEQFGETHSMNDVWKGKTLGIEGRLFYFSGGKKISRIEAVDIREIEDAPLIDLNSVLDPSFTAGLQPNEYLRRLHEGDLE